jgi:predicted peptidase
MLRRRFLTGLVVLATCCFPSLASAESPAPGKQVAMQTAVRIKSEEGERETTIRYLLALPADYDKNPSQKWPLVLFLHGSGERGDELEKVKIHGPPKLVAAGKDFPFVLVSPQCESGNRWNPQELAKLVEHLANTFRIDRQRLYVTGLSMGGAGTWSLVAEYPGMFAAAIPICGRGDLAAATWQPPGS